jgi:pyocin large subunit-like protein
MFSRRLRQLVLVFFVGTLFFVASDRVEDWRAGSPTSFTSKPTISWQRPLAGLRSSWANPATLEDHFARHGADFGARSAEEYTRLAKEFGERARRGELLVKIDDDGTRRVFEAKTGTFAAYNDDWTTKTFFKPRSRDYFARQPGRLVKLGDR